MSFGIGLTYFAIAGLISVVLFLRISENQTYITPEQTPFEGRSRNGYANALRRSNYFEAVNASTGGSSPRSWRRRSAV